MGRAGRIGSRAFVGADSFTLDAAKATYGPRSVLRAAEVYHDWHQKLPDKVLAVEQYDIPRKLNPVGDAVEIGYVSDKWEKDGSAVPYFHVFDSRPQVYRARQPNPKVGPAKSTAALLAVANVDAQLAFPILAIADYLIYETPNGKKHRIAFERTEAPVCSSLDRKTVVVFTDEGPIVIRGGDMSVTWRGIVK